MVLHTPPRLTWGTCVKTATAKEISLLITYLYSISINTGHRMIHQCFSEEWTGFHLMYFNCCSKVIWGKYCEFLCTTAFTPKQPWHLSSSSMVRIDNQRVKASKVRTIPRIMQLPTQNIKLNSQTYSASLLLANYIVG